MFSAVKINRREPEQIALTQRKNNSQRNLRKLMFSAVKINRREPEKIEFTQSGKQTSAKPPLTHVLRGERYTPMLVFWPTSEVAEQNDFSNQ